MDDDERSLRAEGGAPRRGQQVVMDMVYKRERREEVLYLEDAIDQDRIRREEDVDLIHILRQALGWVGGMDDADRVR